MTFSQRAHTIPSRRVVHEFYQRGARTWSDSIRTHRPFNLAARISAVYDLFLGRVSPKPLLVGRSEFERAGNRTEAKP
jgi:hypothetical protein